ncbi:MAG: sigma-70 family RNA polymerase sigma factor [Planctomycetes bacterium]|nr:sigma-70 family RNA polymerase sigma factor [Planctomycetota bacterium]
MSKAKAAKKSPAKAKSKSDKSDIKKQWTSYLKSRDVRIRNTIVEHYSTLVYAHASRLTRRLPAQITYDEICSAAFDGLIEAVQAYDPSRAAKFETFCQQRITGAVMDWLRSLDAQSRTVRTFEKRRMGAREILDSELGRPPTSSEVAVRMDITVARYEQLSRLSQLGKEVHFSAMEPESDSGARATGRGWDVGDTKQIDPSDKVAREFLTDYITRGLTREERLVLILYYYEELTMAEIGLVLDLSESRVSQIHKDVLNRLRQRFAANSSTREMVA